MNYHAVDTRCAVDLSTVGIRMDRAIYTLESLGFRLISIDLESEARECIGAPYKKNATLADAPRAFDCSTFTKWLFAQKGVWIPRLSVQQFEYGHEISLGEMRPDDTIFTDGPVNWYVDDPEKGIGHVGYVTRALTVVHAASPGAGVVETPLERFLTKRTLRGVRRFVSPTVRTFEMPPSNRVEWSDDLAWLIRRHATK